MIMRKLGVLALTFMISFSMLSIFPLVLPSQSDVQEYVIVAYAIPSHDDGRTNPGYELLGYSWSSTITYYVNPSNSYGFSETQVVNSITSSANAWDDETAYQVFSNLGITNRRAGKHDGYNVVSWGKYSLKAIAVTYFWAKHGQVVETDCLINSRYQWSLSGEAAKIDVRDIMTHEFGHWCGLKDLYNDKDYWLTMYGYSDFGLTYARTLGLGDINGLIAVYGP